MHEKAEDQEVSNRPSYPDSIGGQQPRGLDGLRHDVHNSLHLISGYSDLLASRRWGELNTKQQQIVENIQSGIQSLIKALANAEQSEAQLQERR